VQRHLHGESGNPDKEKQHKRENTELNITSLADCKRKRKRCFCKHDGRNQLPGKFRMHAFVFRKFRCSHFQHQRIVVDLDEPDDAGHHATQRKRAKQQHKMFVDLCRKKLF